MGSQGRALLWEFHSHPELGPQTDTRWRAEQKSSTAGTGALDEKSLAVTFLFLIVSGSQRLSPLPVTVGQHVGKRR